VREGKATTSLDGVEIPIVFDVTVVAVSPQEAFDLAERNKSSMDYSVNFMELVDDGSGSNVEAGGNSGQYDVGHLDSRGSRSAAHEYGHLLNYFRQIVGDNDGGDDAMHANPTTESSSTMARNPGRVDPQTSRVNTRDIKRLNGGKAGDFTNATWMSTLGGKKANVGRRLDNHVNIE